MLKPRLFPILPRAAAAAVLLAGCGVKSDPVPVVRTEVPAATEAKPIPPAPQAVEAALSSPALAARPYSADERTEVGQPRADGTRVTTVTTGRVYRDSHGRTRREVVFSDPSRGNATRTTVTITDPVAHVRYELDPDAKIAYRETMANGGVPGGEGERQGGEGERQGGEGERQGGEGERQGGEGERRGGESERRVGESERRVGERRADGGGNPNPLVRKHEDLGTKVMEGLTVRGSRNARTTASDTTNANAVIDERWFAPDFQLGVKSIHIDPRTGQRTHALTNIKQAEPDPSLFRVPAGYTVKDRT